jgi:hypothetical protein
MRTVAATHFRARDYQSYHQPALLVLVDVAANVMFWTNHRVSALSFICGLSLVLITPGLAIDALFFAHLPSRIYRLSLTIPTTLLVLIAGTLLLNLTHVALSVQRPLTADRLMLTIDGMDLILLAAAAWSTRRRRATASRAGSLSRSESPFEHLLLWRGGRPRPLDVGMVGTGLVVDTLIVAGAIRQNNGYSNTVTLIALGLMVVLATAAVFYVERIAPSSLTVVLLLVGLGLALMTSLRGWYVTGHDIQGEFFVFHQVTAQGFWSLSGQTSNYNSCLGITLLAPLLAAVTMIPGPYVWKILFPLLLSTISFPLYAIARQLASRRAAVLAVLVFFAFPTYSIDLPYLGRQEVAMLFVAGLVLVLVERDRTAYRRWLVILLAVGVAVTHYSSAYVCATVLLAAVVGERIVRLAVKLVARRSVRMQEERDRSRSMLPWLPAVLTVGSTLGWSLLVTRNVSQLRAVGVDALQNLGLPVSTPTISTVAAKLQSGSPFQALVSTQRTIATSGGSAGGYYPLSVFRSFHPVAVSVPAVPLTAVGRSLHSAVGISPHLLNGDLRDLLSAFFLLGSLGGVVRLCLRDRLSGNFAWLAVASLGLVGAVNAVPTLGVQYGNQRSFQELLIVLAPCIGFLFDGLAAHVRQSVAIGTFAVTAFVSLVSLSGFLPALTGGYTGTIGVASQGPYYDVYYPQHGEVLAAAWIDSHHPQVLQTDLLTNNRLETFLNVPVDDTDFPYAVERTSWVLLPTETVRDGLGTLGSSDTNKYVYPVKLVSGLKWTVFSDGDASILVPMS